MMLYAARRWRLRTRVLEVRSFVEEFGQFFERHAAQLLGVDARPALLGLVLPEVAHDLVVDRQRVALQHGQQFVRRMTVVEPLHLRLLDRDRAVKGTGVAQASYSWVAGTIQVLASAVSSA